MKLLSRLHLTALAVVVILAVGVGAAVAATQGHHPAPGGKHEGRGNDHACAHGRQLERNKANVVAYYTMAFNDKMPERAVALYGGDEYIQHNPQAADGFQAFIDFVNFFTTQNPQLFVDIKRVIAECNMVVTHSHLTLNPSDRGSAVADLFRLDRNGKIVEHWDVIQAVPETSANDNTMF
jgi:predicted SnoaL-like aldol condensation-catalyzing enzyme